MPQRTFFLIVVGLLGMLVAGCGKGNDAPISSTSTAGSTPTSAPATASPTSVLGVTLAEYQAKPRPDFKIAGMGIGPTPVAPIFAGCPAGTKSEVVSHDSIAGNRMALNPATLPPSSKLERSNGAVACGDTVVSVTLGIGVAPDPNDPENRGGPIDVIRRRMPSCRWQSDVPAEYWKETAVAGRNAAIAAPVVGGKLLSTEVVVCEGDGVMTVLQARFLPTRIVLQIAEGLFAGPPPGP